MVGVLPHMFSNTHARETTRKSRAPYYSNLPAQHHEPPRTGLFNQSFKEYYEVT